MEFYGSCHRKIVCLLFLEFLIFKSASSDFTPASFYKSCEAGTLCFGMRVDPVAGADHCQIRNKNCDLAVSIFRDGISGLFRFFLMGKPPQPQGRNNRGYYVAVGLSTDDRMGEDSVVNCMEGGAIRTKRVDPSWNDMQQHNNPLTDESYLGRDSTVEFVDGILRCDFRRHAASTIEGREFNLNTTSGFFLLLAMGNLQPDMTQDRISYHTQKHRLASPSPIFQPRNIIAYNHSSVLFNFQIYLLVLFEFFCIYFINNF